MPETRGYGAAWSSSPGVSWSFRRTAPWSDGIASVPPTGVAGRTACVYLRQSSQTQVEFNREHAQLLSRPEIDPNGSSITWFSAPLGPVRKLAELAEAERQPIETLRRQLLAEIGQLAGR